ncbi:polysaccharide lyase [Halomontanus rarus]|uniref:polysaccharide lyase n=1 Tax=Halomontanus rarus TaxID=3034020 RepID=UPI001F61776B
MGLGSNSASASAGTDPAAYLDSADDYNHVSFDGNWKQWFTNTHGGYTSTTTNHSRDGNALRVRWPAGEYYGATMEYLMEQNHGYQPDAGHVRYWVYFPDGWQFDSAGLGGTKLPGFAGTYQTGNHDIGPGGYGGRPADGTNGWSARIFNCRPDRAGGQGPIALGSQVYHAGDGGQHGAHPKWNGALETGTWHRIDQYVEMNTPGQTDGAYRTWIDGDLALEMEGLYFRDAGYGDLIGIQTLWAMFYFGGDWGSPVDQHMLFDDVKLWLWHDRPETTGGSGGQREPVDEAASVTTGAVDVGAESVTVEANVESVGGRDDLELWIGYRESGDSGWMWTGGDAVSGTGSHTYTVSGLSTGTTYELRAELWVGSNDIDFGKIETVTTGEETASADDSEGNDEASVATGAVDVGADSVTVEADVVSVGGRDDLELWIGYRESWEDGWAWTGGDRVSDAGDHTITVDGLHEAVEYELRAELWVGSDDIDFGEIETVTTGENGDEVAEEPAVETGSVDTGAESFRVEADVVSVGGRDDLELWIGYRESWENGWAWTGGDIVSDSGTQALTVDGLHQGTEYELRAELWVGFDDIDFGEIVTVTTGR